MDNTLHLAIAIFVFIMMIIGLALTIKEFKYGSPGKQERYNEQINNDKLSSEQLGRSMR